MTLDYRVVALGDQWPGGRTTNRRHAPFKENWSGTLRLLERELGQLDARDVTLGVAVHASRLRNDGQMYADARVRDSGVILSFTVGADRLSFPCDTFLFWQHNVRAIALALEALRKVDRYGVQKGRQYVGFKALPGAGGSTTTMSVDEAARVIIDEADTIIVDESGRQLQGQLASDQLTRERAVADSLIRLAVRNTHPDTPGGSAEAFARVQTAKAVLGAHHGLR